MAETIYNKLQEIRNCPVGLCGHCEELLMSAQSDIEDLPENAELLSLIEQLCKDLNGAQSEIVELQGGDPLKFDWPEWTPQANSIRQAEKILKRKLAKTNNWTLYPSENLTHHANK